MKWKSRWMSVVIVLFLAVNSIPVVYGENGNVDHTDTEEETVSPSITFHLPEGDGSVRDDGQIWYKNNKELELIVQDEDSGICNVDVSVNGIDVPEDKKATALLKSEKGEGSCNREPLHYVFDLDYFTAVCERAGDRQSAEEGKYEIAVAVTDHAGNAANYNAEYFIDKVPPAVSGIAFIPELPDGMEDTAELIEEFAIDEFTYGYYFRADYRVVVNVTDDVPSSGPGQMKYRLVPYEDGAEQEEITGSLEIADGKAELEIPEGFRGRIFAEVFDCVGNSQGEKLVKAEDNSAPVIEITDMADTGYQDGAGNRLYTEGNSFTVKITDVVSGIRAFGYRQNAEQNPCDRRMITLDNDEYAPGENLGDGWLVTGMEDNLVTQVTKTYDFTADDNNVTVIFDAVDGSGNQIQDVRSETFTIDKTSPDIRVEFQDDRTAYYKQSRVARITVTERNFDAGLTDIRIENTSGDVPEYVFEEISETEHVAVIDFGEGEYTFELQGRDLGNQSARIAYDGEPVESFCIDRTKPDVKITHIDGNFQQSVKANITLSDSRSGIAKVEYLWDDGFLLQEGESEYRTDYAEFKGYSDDRTEFELILPWHLAKTVPGNRHTLHLRVTDKAGNVYDDEEPVTDSVGSDMLPPQIERIEIRKPQSDNSEGILKFFTFGTFYKNTVEVAVKVNDNEAREEFYASGVKSVKINDKEAVQSEESDEYVLAVRPDEIMTAMRIRVEDRVGLLTEALATDIPERGLVRSNDLIVEDDVPSIDFGGILSQAHEDGQGRMWFGANDGDVEMKITAADCQGPLHSGLYSVTVKDNGRVEYARSDFSFKTEEHTTVFRIGDLNDGEHIFTVEAEDNCGNTVSSSVTFYKDTNPPEKGSIAAISPESVNIGGSQWFDREEVIIFRVDAADTASGRF